jgi:hypothetical protein
MELATRHSTAVARIRSVPTDDVPIVALTTREARPSGDRERAFADAGLSSCSRTHASALAPDARRSTRGSRSNEPSLSKDVAEGEESEPLLDITRARR